jgi:hypothetical protein
MVVATDASTWLRVWNPARRPDVTSAANEVFMVRHG